METSKDSRQNTSKSSWGLDDNIKLLDFMGNCEGKSWRDLVNQFDGKLVYGCEYYPPGNIHIHTMNSLRFFY